ncbi:MAG TPA: aldo/keto reductase [Woeseiaceae bacterium]
MTEPVYKTFGATDLKVPLVGQGTWNMERDSKRSVDALRYGIQLGLTHIDTAEIYGDGAVETLVGHAVHGMRERAVLVSKVHPKNASRNGVIEACERTLRRLGTNYLDVYLLHWVSSHPVAETVAGFDSLVAAGKIRHWGVSNLDEVKLAEFVEVAGAARICCNQVMHHLAERSIEHAVVPYCRDQRIAVVGYSPFGKGDFPPKSRSGAQVLSDVALTVDATPRQVALAFLIRKSGGFTIPKASQRSHVEENAQAAALILPDDAVQRLDEEFPLGPRSEGVPVW